MMNSIQRDFSRAGILNLSHSNGLKLVYKTLVNDLLTLTTPCSYNLQRLSTLKVLICVCRYLERLLVKGGHVLLQFQSLCLPVRTSQKLTMNISKCIAVCVYVSVYV